MRSFVTLVVILVSGSTAFAQAPVPMGQKPHIGLASAVEKDVKVVIEVFELREVMRMKLPSGNDVFVEKRHWTTLTTGTLGKDIRAYRHDGKLATTKEVLTALAKPRGVAYFLGYDKAKPIQPDPFFLAVINEGTVILALDRPELAPPPCLDGRTLETEKNRHVGTSE